MKRLNLTLLFFAIFFMIPAHALAAPVSLTISPPKFDLVVVPGQSSAHTIRITNAQENDVSFVATAMDFAPSDNIGGIAVASQIEGHSSRDWFHMKPEKFTLKPNQTQLIEVTIKPPAELDPGSYFAVVMMQAQNNQGQIDNSDKETIITPWIGSLFFLRYGDISALGQNALSIKMIEHPRLQLGGDMPVTVEVENHTPFHLLTTTAFRLRGLAGLGSTEPIKQELTIMPDSTRRFQLTVKRPPSGIQRGIALTSSGAIQQEAMTKSILTLTSNGVLGLIGIGILIDLIRRYMRKSHHRKAGTGRLIHALRHLTKKTHHLVKRVHNWRQTRTRKSTEK